MSEPLPYFMATQSVNKSLISIAFISPTLQVHKPLVRNFDARCHPNAVSVYRDSVLIL